MENIAPSTARTSLSEEGAAEEKARGGHESGRSSQDLLLPGQVPPRGKLQV